MAGIFITKGMTVSIPHLRIKIGEGGDIEGDPITLHVRFDVCPTWVMLARRHLEAALDARSQRDAIWARTDETAKAESLEREFECSMQAIMAAAIAWDAAYAVLREHVAIPDSLVQRWRAGRTARYSQVAEVIRRAFTLKPAGAKVLRSNLKEIYRYRDMAVHPSGKIQAALLHPELNVGVEWRFAYFRATNAEIAVCGAAGMLWDLAHEGRAKEPKITEYQETLRARLQEIYPAGRPVAAVSGGASAA